MFLSLLFIQAWMPGKQFWGEISSCSDCTDYQARRLNITDDNGRYVDLLIRCESIPYIITDILTFYGGDSLF